MAKVADCESNAAAPTIDTILAVGFAAATLAAVAGETDPELADEASAVSVLGVGAATTAAFIASAAHGHNSIQSCLALRKSPTTNTKVARVVKTSAAEVVSQATYTASVTAAAR